MLLKIISSFLIILFTVCFAESSYKFDHLTIDDGLSQSSVQAIVQDSLGFMWFGTEDGLNQYDGYNFKNFFHDPADSRTISSNIILSLIIDSHNRFWIGTRVGLNRYDPKRNIFKRYLNDPENPYSICDNFIRCIYPDPYNSQIIWIGTKNGLSRLDTGTGTFKNYFDNESSSYIWTIFKDNKGTLWLGTDKNGLFACRFRGDQLIFSKNYMPKRANGLSYGKISSIIGLVENQLLIGCENSGLLTFNPKNKNFKKLSISGIKSPFNIEKIIKVDNPETEYWVGTDGDGVLILDGNLLLKDWVKWDSSYPSSLNNNNILSIYQNAQGLIWIGTNGNGINKLNLRRSAIGSYFHIPHLKNSLSHNHILSIFQEKNSNILWIGTDGGGLNKYNIRNKKWDFYDTKNSAISGNRIRALKGGENNYLWIGTWGGGLNLLNLRTNRITHFGKNGQEATKIISDYIRSLSIDRDGVIWAGSNDGLISCTIKNEKPSFRFWQNDKQNSVSLSGNQIRIVYTDPLNRIWIGTFNNGLNLYDRQNDKFLHYRQQTENKQGLTSDHILSILVQESAPDIVWIGTFGGGLNRLDLASGEVSSFTKKDGLPNNVIYGILNDDKGNLWLSTNKGIVKFNPLTKKLHIFNHSDGFQSDEFNGGAYFKNHEGKMFFGGIKGLSFFFPADLKLNRNTPRIVLTDFRIYNIPVMVAREDKNSDKDKTFKIKKCTSYIDKIELAHNQSVITFEFSALDFFISEKNSYAYRLDGVDTDWMYSGRRRFVTYSNLSPGRYVFRVKGSNCDGIWNNAGMTLRITINPPWWGSYQAKFIYIILFLLLIFIVVNWKISQVKKNAASTILSKTLELKITQAEMEKRVESDEMRIRIASDLHDEIGSNLSSIGLISQLVLEESQINKRMKYQLQKILDIARDSSESLRDIVWFINPKNDGFNNLVMKINNMAKSMLEGKIVKISTLPESFENDTDINFNRNYFLIVKEILQNIIKHAKADKININWSKTDKQCSLRIYDNGQGFDVTDTTNRGNGLRNIYRRAQIIGLDLKIQSAIHKGTTVEMVFKIP